MATDPPEDRQTVPLPAPAVKARAALGVAPSSDGSGAVASLLRIAGDGLDAAATLVATGRADLPEGTQKALAALHSSDEAQPASVRWRQRLADDYVDVCAALSDRLVSESGLADDALVLGVADEFAQSPVESVGGLSLNTCQLAEASGLNVVDSFAARDRARGGRGSPLTPLPCWLLLADRRPGGGRTRMLVELGDRTTLTCLPPRGATVSSPVRSPAVTVQTGPGDNNAATVDFIADAIDSRPEQMPQVSQIILAGPKRADQALLRAIASRLPITLMPITELGFEEENLPSACAALLALLHIDQTPANVPEITGAEAPRVLGRLTPGSPARWRRLLLLMAQRNRSVLPLRSAV